MEPPGVFTLILALITFLTAPSCSQEIEASQNPLPVGSTVTLTSTVNADAGTWTFETDLIVLIFPGSPVVSNAWASRTTFNSTTSSLTISSLQTQDTGVYRLQAVNQFTAEILLNVQVPISGVTLTAHETNLVEFNDTAVLMCSVSNGSSLSYVWMMNDFEITDDERIQISEEGANLTIHNVTRHDAGNYRCIVSNLLGSETSPPVNLRISYGPTAATMTIMPEGNTFITGSNITLSCSAESSPSATIQWMRDGIILDIVGSQLQLMMAEENNSGYYKCLFHNIVTMRYSSVSAMIKIVKPIEAVHVTKTDGPTIAGGELTLQCNVTGSVTKISWWRNQQIISADSSTTLVNKTLILNPVNISDGGAYECEAINEVSSKMSSPFIITVNYGPMKPEITGPLMALTETTVKLNCSSDSHPDSEIKWYFGDSMLAAIPGITIGPLNLNMSGEYTCMAFNNVTNKSSSSYTMLTVFAPVTMAEIKPDETNPIAGQPFDLNCETAGSVDTITWIHGEALVSDDDMRTLSIDNTTLTFDPVKRSDAGHYQCIASNPFSHFTSENFTLEVFFGPMMPTIVGPEGAIPGENVTFICDAQSNPPSSYVWYFNDSIVANTAEYITPPLNLDLMGMYTCMALNNVTGENMTAHTMLTVVDPIMRVHIVAPPPPPIEGHVYMLTCNVSGPVQHVSWMKDHQPLVEDSRMTINMTDMTIKIDPLFHNDTGKYQCAAFNIAGNMTSPPLMVYVNFGPETPVIHGPSYAEVKQEALFNCSAQSMPPAQYSWWFNGSEVANTSVFRTKPITYNMSGEYTCKAYNHVTGKNSTNSQMLKVIEAVESVVIINNTIPIQPQNFTLTCNVTGPYDAIYWMRNGMKLNMCARTNMSYHSAEDNKLHFAPVTRDDDGLYQCVAITKAMNHPSNPYTLLTIYGPMLLKIFAPDSAPIGVTMYMTCMAESNPECTYRWFYNDLDNPLPGNSILSFPVTNQSDGTYICEAKNPITENTMYQTKDFSADAVGLQSQSKAALMMIGLLTFSVNVFFI